MTLHTLRIESTSVEPIRVPVVSEIDPDVNLPQFMLTATTATDPTDTWVNGEWDGSWNAANGTGLVAVTPPTGSTDFELSGVQTLWIRWTAGPHTPVAAIARVRAT